MRRLLFLCTLITALPLWTASAASPQDGSVVVNFSVVPGKPVLLHQSPQYGFTLSTPPGQVIHDFVAVANGSHTAPLTVALSVSDAQTPRSGAGLAFMDTSAQHQIGRWTRLYTDTVTVPPNAIKIMPITLSVPAGTRPGEYEGSVSATTLSGVQYTNGGTRTNIHFTKRCLIYLRVLGHASAGLQILGTRLADTPSTAQKRRTIFTIALKNTGTVIATPTTTIMTFAGRAKTYTIRPTIRAVTGGASTIVGFDLSRTLPPGTYRASIALVYNVRPQYPGPYQQRHATWVGAVIVPANSGR